MQDIKITIEDVVFFLDMIDSTKSPNFKPKMYKQKPYYTLFKDKDSGDYKRFVSIYKTIRNVLPKRMQIVLNEIYGVDKKECPQLKPVGVILNISPERVRQIIYRAESILAKELSLAFGNNIKNKAWR